MIYVMFGCFVYCLFIYLVVGWKVAFCDLFNVCLVVVFIVCLVVGW